MSYVCRCEPPILTNPAHNMVIKLPDGTIKTVTQFGTVNLSNTLTLTKVLHVPSFQHNLLSMSQLSKYLLVFFTFLDCVCLLQDQRTKDVLAIGKELSKLYIFHRESFSPKSQIELLKNYYVLNASGLWH